MKAFCLTNLGLEKISIDEISKLIKIKNSKITGSIISFDIDSFKDLEKIYYYSQSIKRASLLLFETDISDDFSDIVEKLNKKISESNFNEFMKEKYRFKVECIREGSHQFKSVDIVRNISKSIKDKYKQDTGKEILPVYKGENISFLIYINDSKCYFGIDFSSIDLSKRDYKIFNHNESMSPTIAYSLIKYAKVKKDSKILDPFCGTGAIPIEAAVSFSNIPINKNKDFMFKNEKYYDDNLIIENNEISEEEKNIFAFDKEFRHIRNAIKNATVAGVENKIEFKECAIKNISKENYLDFFDFIITDPPIDSKKKSKETIRNLYKEFLNQSNSILKKKGRIILIVKLNSMIEEIIIESGF